MPINTHYKDCLCIKKMRDSDKATFDMLVNTYGEILNKGNSKKPILYTLHDFDHHCINIFHIISTIILDKTYLGDQNGITDDELFILNLSVLFHDISMATDIHCDRKKHSLQSAEFVQEESLRTNTALARAIDSPNIIYALAQIIQAHSDVKDGFDNPNNGIMNPDLKELMPVQTGEIRAKLLAGILRLGDELDVTNNRMGDSSFAKQLSEDDPEEAESKRHWNKLNYFCTHSRDDLTGDVRLIVAESYAKAEIEAGNLQNVVDIIRGVEDKVRKEFAEIDKIVFKTTQFASHIIGIKSIYVFCEIEELATALKEDLTRANIQPSATPTLLEEAKEQLQVVQTEAVEQFLPAILNSEFVKEIDDIIENRNLIDTGHYLLDRIYCARDWIDTAEILETEDLFNNCAKIICHHIKEKFELNEKVAIVGLDFGGTLLASRIAFTLKMPFTFILPVQPIDKDVSHDKEVKLEGYDKVILVADAIATFETVVSAIEEYNIKDKIIGIYTVLYRIPTNEKIAEKRNLLSITYSLNNNYPIEVFKREKCKRWENKCIAKNKPIC